MSIHPTAVIDPAAELGARVTVGPYAVIEAGVRIGDGSKIGPHACIHRGTTLGVGVQVFQSASVGCLPQDLKYKGEETFLEVGDRTVIREFATLSIGTTDAWTTRVGSDCLLMSYTHLAHDVQVGKKCILANLVQLAGHVIVGDEVIIGGTAAVHQFVHIGDHAFVGGGMQVTKDVPPFILANGSPLRYCGLNSLGLTRRGFSKERLAAIKKHYKLFFGKGSSNVSQGLEALQPLAETEPDAKLMYDFIQAANRGLLSG
jgi:UDP-N-acetylglucosamine acyltransferase